MYNILLLFFSLVFKFFFPMSIQIFFFKSTLHVKGFVREVQFFYMKKMCQSIYKIENRPTLLDGYYIESLESPTCKFLELSFEHPTKPLIKPHSFYFLPS